MKCKKCGGNVIGIVEKVRNKNPKLVERSGEQ